MYEPLYDDKHRFFGISSTPSKPNKLFQKGLRERLLCDECERRLSNYEDYARDVFFGNAITRPTQCPTGLRFAELKYKPLKLFFMSLLWRLSVTTLDYYKGMNLGRHQERLRQQLVSDDAADYLTYPCMITAVMIDNKHFPDVIVPPSRTRFDGQRVWVFVIAGFLYHFFVSNQPPPAKMRGGFLQENGTLVLNISDVREIPSLRHWMSKIAAAERARTSHG
jgi:hypothetical protein